VTVLYYLFPSSIDTSTKLQRVREVISWRPDHAPQDFGLIEGAFARGLGNPGPQYQTAQREHIAYYLDFAIHLRQGEASIQEIRPLACAWPILSARSEEAAEQADTSFFICSSRITLAKNVAFLLFTDRDSPTRAWRLSDGRSLSDFGSWRSRAA
jgi:hypothetical protein